MQEINLCLVCLGQIWGLDKLWEPLQVLVFEPIVTLSVVAVENILGIYIEIGSFKHTKY